MNAVAQLLLSQGFQVSGSDRFADQGVHLPVLDALQDLGLKLVPQDGGGLREDTAALVLSSAVEADNPERLRAKALGVPERHRAEMLAEICGRGPLAAVAGTSGKTSCTGWLAWILEQCGRDPNMVNGGGVIAWRNRGLPGNVRIGGKKDWWVVEVDESDRSLLNFNPQVALINTISEDHHSMADTVELFRTFASRVTDALVCGPGVAALLEGTGPRLIEVQAPLEVPLPGRHNAWNAAAAVEMAVVCGAPRNGAVEAARTFPGVERRLEVCSLPGAGPRVYDDYAHNPEKLLAAIQAVQPETGRLVMVWRPHGFAPLTQNFDAYVEAFAVGMRGSDRLHLLPVFYAGGTAPSGVGSEDLADALRTRGVTAGVMDSYPESIGLQPEDVLLVAGARDPQLPVFAHRMGAVLSGTDAR
jgi:UDP-N-acetylmuramate--alanine ligase